MKISSIALTSLFFAAPVNAFLPPSVSSSHQRVVLYGTRRHLAFTWKNAEQRGQNPAQVTVDKAKSSVNQAIIAALKYDVVTEDSIERAFAEFEALGGGDLPVFETEDTSSLLLDAVGDAEAEFYEDMAKASKEVEKEKFITAIAEAEDKFHDAVKYAEASIAKAAEARRVAKEEASAAFVLDEMHVEGEGITTKAPKATKKKKKKTVQAQFSAFMEDPAVKEISKFVESTHIKEEAPKIAEKVGDAISHAAGMLMWGVEGVVTPVLEQVGTSLKEAKAARQLQGQDEKVLDDHLESVEQLLADSKKEEKILADHMDNVQQVLMEAERATQAKPLYDNYFE